MNLHKVGLTFKMIKMRGDNPMFRQTANFSQYLSEFSTDLHKNLHKGGLTFRDDWNKDNNPCFD